MDIEIDRLEDSGVMSQGRKYRRQEGSWVGN